MQSWVFFPHPTGSAEHLTGKAWVLRSNQRTVATRGSTDGSLQALPTGASSLCMGLQGRAVLACKHCRLREVWVFKHVTGGTRELSPRGRTENQGRERGGRSWGGRWGRWRSCNIVNSLWGTLNQGECQTPQCLYWDGTDTHTHTNPFYNCSNTIHLSSTVSFSSLTNTSCSGFSFSPALWHSCSNIPFTDISSPFLPTTLIRIHPVYVLLQSSSPQPALFLSWHLFKPRTLTRFAAQVVNLSLFCPPATLGYAAQWWLQSYVQADLCLSESKSLPSHLPLCITFIKLPSTVQVSEFLYRTTQRVASALLRCLFIFLFLLNTPLSDTHIVATLWQAFN